MKRQKRKFSKDNVSFKASESTCPDYILKRPRIPLCKDLDQKLTIFGNQDTNLKAIKPHSNQKTLIRKVLLILSEKCIQNVVERVEKLFHKSAKVRDPVTNSVLKLKKLVKVKFIPIDDSISDTKRQAAKARWKVRHLYSSQGSSIFYSVRYPEMF